MTETAPTLADHGYDGRAALVWTVAQSPYRTVAQAVAALTLFSHPATVAQIPGGALFPCIRSLGRADRRTIVTREGRRLGLDDNAVAHARFAWSNGRARPGRDVQLNHVFPSRDDPCAFTALANLAVSPSFLAKLTDHDDDIVALLQMRALDLYGFAPEGARRPHRSKIYADLTWAAPLPAVEALEKRLRLRMNQAPRHFASQVAREVGWAFSGFRPDPALA